MSAKLSQVKVNLITALASHAHPQQLGVVFEGACGYFLPSLGEPQVRNPDVSFVTTGRLPDDLAPSGDLQLAPDLVVKAISTEDIALETEKRLAEFIESGTHLVWVIYPEARSVQVYRQDGSVSRLAPGKMLSGENIVPGFQYALADLFTDLRLARVFGTPAHTNGMAEASEPPAGLVLQRGQEWVDGRIVEKPMGMQAGVVMANVAAELGLYLRTNPVGIFSVADARYRLPGLGKRQIRVPDLSVVLKGRLPDDKPSEGETDLAPDLAVEVISPNDLAADIEKRIGEFLQAGTLLVWVLYPVTRSVHVFRADSSGCRLRSAATLSGEAILPGLAIRLDDIFANL